MYKIYIRCLYWPKGGETEGKKGRQRQNKKKERAWKTRKEENKKKGEAWQKRGRNGRKKEEKRKKEGEKERQAAGKTRKSKRTQTPLAHHNFNVIVFVHQEARVSCFLVFCFISCKTGSAGVSSLVLQLREL